MEAQNLTQSQKVIAELIAKQLTNKEIADRIYRTPKTVENHVSNIMKRWDVKSRVGIAVKYVVKNSKTFTLSVALLTVQVFGMTISNDDVRVTRSRKSRRNQTEILA